MGRGERASRPKDLDGYGATWIDDETILFQGRPSGTIEIGDLYVADISTGDLTMVVDLPDMRNESWFIRSDLSPDGMTVLFHLPRGQGGRTKWDLWTAPIEGRGAPKLLRKNAGFAQYAPDGSIVFLDAPDDFVASQDLDHGWRRQRRAVAGRARGAFTSGPRFLPTARWSPTT